MLDLKKIDPANILLTAKTLFIIGPGKQKLKFSMLVPSHDRQ
jgi:hypothetical protein